MSDILAGPGTYEIKNQDSNNLKGSFSKLGRKSDIFQY